MVSPDRLICSVYQDRPIETRKSIHIKLLNNVKNISILHMSCPSKLGLLMYEGKVAKKTYHFQTKQCDNAFTKSNIIHVMSHNT